MEPREPDVDIDQNEARDTEEEVESDTEELSEETVRQLYEASSEVVDRVRQDLFRGWNNVSASADVEIEMDEIDSTYSSSFDSGEATYGSEGRGSRLEGAENEAQRQREEEIGTQDRKGRIWTRTKGIALFVAMFAAASTFTSMVTAVLGYVDKKNEKDGDKDDGPEGLTEDQKKQLEEQIERWWALPDAEIWDRMAQFCDRWNPSLQGQVLMMDTIKRLSKKLDPPWNWRGGDNQWSAIEATMDAYADFTPGTGQSKSRAIYETVRDYRFDGFGRGPEALPRQIAADVAELALYQIILLETGRSDQAA